MEGVLENWPLATGWLLFILLLLLSSRNAFYRPARFPVFLILASVTFLSIAESFNLPDILPIGFFLFGISLAFLIARVSMYLVFDLIVDRRRGVSTPALMRAIALFSLVLVILLIYNEFLPSEVRFDATSILASAAVISVVLGFALQDTLGNLFSGLALHLERPVKVGQWVRIGETAGEVVEMDWRSIKLRTLSYDYHVIPNTLAANKIIINYNDPPVPHRREVLVRGPWSASPDSVRGAIMPILENHPEIARSPKPVVVLRNFGEHWIDYEVRYWYTDYRRTEMIDAEIRRQVWYHFHRSRIENPTPVHSVTMRSDDRAPGGRDQRREELANWLRDIAIFQPLDENELRQAAEGMTFGLYAAGEPIICQNAVGDSFFVIYSGEAEVSVADESGGRSVVKLLRRGDYFGEMALLTGEKRTATITAITESACYILGKDIFSDLLKGNPRIAEALSELLSQRREELEESISVMRERGAAREAAQSKRSLLAKIKNYFGL